MSTCRSKERRILLKLLKELRINAGLRQVDLAQTIGVSQSRISKYEMGERRLDFLEMREICCALGLSLSKFVQLLENRLAEEKHETD